MRTDRPDDRAPEAGTAAVVGVLVGFAKTLRAAGVPVGGHRLQTFLSALAELDPRAREDVYWAGRVTLCGHADDLGPYDRAFAAYFGDRNVFPPARARVQARASARLWTDLALPGAENAEPRQSLTASKASSTDVLRRADLARLTAAQRSQVHRLIALLSAHPATRRTRRHEPTRRGALDRAATVRALVRAHGELDSLRHRRQRRRPRRLVVLVDVSGSMEPYAQAMLRFAHGARQRGGPTEVFCLGTRLTRLTDALAHRDPDRAMAAVASRIADWSGGTRLGAGLGAFLDDWGQPGMARGAVVVICSDGWERDDPAVLGAQMERLGRLAHRVVWANPLKARAGYAPVAGGMAAALPHVDDFVAGHSVAALEHLARVVAGSATTRPIRASRRHDEEDDHA